MTYHVQSRWGDSETEPSRERMWELLQELDASDPEHPDTWLIHDNGWSLAMHETGVLVWENAHQDQLPVHLPNVSRDKALSLWLQLAAGNLAEIAKESWVDGYGPPRGDDEAARLAKESADYTLKYDREFYDGLGPERQEKQCREAGCARGAIVNSIFCRPHHFESIRRKPCPFSD